MIPTTLTLVRHGESEGNVGTKLHKNGHHDKLTPGYYDNHDSHVRLTPRGIEQAHAAGEWLLKNEPAARFFDYTRYVSPYVRTRETAAHLQLGGQWQVEPLIRERDWGEVSRPHPTEGTRISEHSATMRELNPWYWQPQGGESLSTDVTARVNMFMQLLKERMQNEYDSAWHTTYGEHTLAVSHGEYLRTVMANIEHYGEETHNRMIREKSHPIPNTFIIQYTRVNPENSEDIRDTYTWRRGICPWDGTRSWDNGNWTDISNNHRLHSDEDLLNYVEQFPHIF